MWGSSRSSVWRGRAVRLILSASVALSGSAAYLVVAGPASAAAGCESYVAYDALGSAVGIRVIQETAGLTLADGHAAMPQAQAKVGALDGSNASAGAPYSATASDNVGLVPVFSGGNDIPVFAVSSYPEPAKSDKSAGSVTIKAESAERSSTATAAGPGPASESASSGRASTTAAAKCAEDGSLDAVADSTVEIIDIKGVLRIGSVRAHARVALDPTGQPTYESSMVVEGASVAGQPIAITNEGPVPPGAASPLADAGIELRYVEAITDEERGQVTSPGLEIVVTTGVAGVGTGDRRTIYSVGRALASASVAADESLVAEEDMFFGESLGEVSTDTGSVADDTSIAAPATGDPAPRPGARQVFSAARPIANTSVESIYPALVGGAVLFLGAWFLFKQLGVRLRWT